MDAFTFVLESLDDTARLGTLLAGMMQNAPQVRALLLQGDLGSGKTTLTRSLVAGWRPGRDLQSVLHHLQQLSHLPACPALRPLPLPGLPSRRSLGRPGRRCRHLHRGMGPVYPRSGPSQGISGHPAGVMRKGTIPDGNGAWAGVSGSGSGAAYSLDHIRTARLPDGSAPFFVRQVHQWNLA